MGIEPYRNIVTIKFYTSNISIDNLNVIDTSVISDTDIESLRNEVRYLNNKYEELLLRADIKNSLHKSFVNPKYAIITSPTII